jgi:hypothetical protein
LRFRTLFAERILKPWAEGLFNRFDAIKFLSYVGDERDMLYGRAELENHEWSKKHTF